MIPEKSLSPSQLAVARHRLYGLFARLFRHGPTPELARLVASLPGLAEHLPDPYDEDESAAEHFRLLGREIPPHESLFLDADGLLGGPVAERVLADYRRCGFRPDPNASGADAISEELGLLAFLSGAEADAWEDGKAGVAQRMADLQGEFLAEHLLAWLHPFALAVQAEESPFYAALAGLLVEMVAEQATAIHPAGRGQPPVALPEAPDLLNDEAAGLREIAAYLTAPPLSGIYLSRGAIGRVGRAHRLPRGFGTKAQMLETLLRGAAQYEQLPSVAESLHGVFDAWHARYAAAMDEHPHLQAYIHPWQVQTGPARQLLIRLATAGSQRFEAEQSDQPLPNQPLGKA